MEAKDTGDEDGWDEDGASSTSESGPADHSNGPTTGASAGVSTVGDSTTQGGGGGGAGDAGATSNIKPKRTNRKRSKGGRIAADITKDELAQYFNMPTEEAAARLGIGLTVLKRVCRKHGVTRWPYRKVKSLDRLMLNVQSGVAPGQSNKHLMVSPEEILQHKEKMCKGDALDIDPETRRLQQAYSKFNHKLRKTHKYDLMSRQMITGSSSAEVEASQSARLALSNGTTAKPGETSSQVPGGTLASTAQEADSSFRTQVDVGARPDAGSHLTGHPMDPSLQARYLQYPGMHMRPSGADGASRMGPGHPTQEELKQMMGQAAHNAGDAANGAVQGGLMNILHSIPPWATLSTFLSSGAIPDLTPNLPNINSRAWLDALTSQDGGLPSSLFSTLQTPSIPLLTHLTAPPTPPNQDPNTHPAQLPHPNILLQATAPGVHPAAHAFALNSSWQMPQGAVFNASLAIVPAHNAGNINTAPAVVGVTPFAAAATATATMPTGLPIPAVKESSPSFSPVPQSTAQEGSGTPPDASNAHAQGAQTDTPNGHSPGTKPDNPDVGASNPGSNHSPSVPNANTAAGSSNAGQDTNIATTGRINGPRKRSVFEKIQQELTHRGSLPTSASMGVPVTAAALLQQSMLPATDLDAPPAKRAAPSPPEDANQQGIVQQVLQQQQQQNGTVHETSAAATLLDRLLPVSMFGGMPSGVPVPTSHSMLAHVMDPPVLLSVNLQSLHSLLPFFHSTEVPTSAAAVTAAVPASSQSPGAPEPPSHHPASQETKAVDRATTGQNGALQAPLLPQPATFPPLSLPSPAPAVQSSPLVSPSRPVTSDTTTPTVPTASALPQAEAMAFLQAQAHSMSRLAQNQRLVQLQRPIPSTHMMDMLMGANTNMSQVSDAQALAVLQLAALEMGWVLESVELIRLSAPISSTVNAMPKTRSIRSRVTSVNGRPPVPAAPQPGGSPAPSAAQVGLLPRPSPT